MKRKSRLERARAVRDEVESQALRQEILPALHKAAARQRLERARAVRDEITRLRDEQDKLYAKVLKTLGLGDTARVYEYFYLMPNGGDSQFEEELQ